MKWIKVYTFLLNHSMAGVPTRHCSMNVNPPHGKCPHQTLPIFPRFTYSMTGVSTSYLVLQGLWTLQLTVLTSFYWSFYYIIITLSKILVTSAKQFVKLKGLTNHLKVQFTLWWFSYVLQLIMWIFLFLILRQPLKESEVYLYYNIKAFYESF